jgi:hypothetical protein
MNLQNFPSDLRPIVQPIDTWFINRKLAMLFEARVGKGKIVVCSIDLEKKNAGPAVQQFYRSLTAYMNGPEFTPSQQIEWNDIQELFEQKERPTWANF